MEGGCSEGGGDEYVHVHVMTVGLLRYIIIEEVKSEVQFVMVAG